MPRQNTTVIWLTAPKAPAPCDMDTSLACEIPTARYSLIQEGGTCLTRDGKCAGINNADTVFALRALEELNWRISH